MYCMYVCMYVNVCMYVCMCMYVCECVYICNTHTKFIMTVCI